MRLLKAQAGTVATSLSAHLQAQQQLQLLLQQHCSAVTGQRLQLLKVTGVYIHGFHRWLWEALRRQGDSHHPKEHTGPEGWQPHSLNAALYAQLLLD